MLLCEVRAVKKVGARTFALVDAGWLALVTASIVPVRA